MYQQTVIVGRVGVDAILNYTQTGIAVCKFSVATSKVTGKGEGRKEKTTWWNVTLFRERAENLSQFIRKGDRIMVIGEIDASAYANKQGQPAASLELTASNVTLLGSRERIEPADLSDDFDPADIPF